MSKITDYLANWDKIKREHMGLPPGSNETLESFILKHGRAFDPAPLPQGMERGIPKECFANSWGLARSARYIYVEGYASNIIPVHHAWCVTPEGRVVDITWEHKPHLQYFGVAFRTPFVRQFRRKHKGTSLLDCYWEDWPLLAGKYQPDEFLQPINPQPIGERHDQD